MSHMSIAPVLVAFIGRRTPIEIAVVFVLTVLLSLGLSLVLVPMELKINAMRRRISAQLGGRRDDRSSTLAGQPGRAPPAKPVHVATLDSMPAQALLKGQGADNPQ
jgi:hypothetical protein